MLALLDLFQGVGDRDHSRAHIFKRRFFEPNALERLRDGAEDSTQRRVESERSEERLRFDQLVHIALHVLDAEEQDSVAGEEFAAVRPGDGAYDVFPIDESLDQCVRRLIGRFRGRPVDDGDQLVGPLRKEIVELDLLLAPGKRTRQKLARVGVDGDMARDVDAGENRRDEKGRDDDPRVTGRQAHNPRDRGDD